MEHEPLSKVEVQILEALQRDGRLSVQDLAQRVGASATVCWRRLKALAERGVIRRTVALLDPRRAGVGEVAFARIRLSMHDDASVQRFEREVSARAEVLECYAVMGDADFQLKIAVPGIAEYNEFLQSFLRQVPGIAHVESSFALREVKNDPALPLSRYVR